MAELAVLPAHPARGVSAFRFTANLGSVLPSVFLSLPPSSHFLPATRHPILPIQPHSKPIACSSASPSGLVHCAITSPFAAPPFRPSRALVSAKADAIFINHRRAINISLFLSTTYSYFSKTAKPSATAPLYAGSGILCNFGRFHLLNLLTPAQLRRKPVIPTNQTTLLYRTPNTFGPRPTLLFIGGQK